MGKLRLTNNGLSALLVSVAALLLVIATTSAVSADDSKSISDTVDVEGVAVSMDELEPVGNEKVKRDKKVTRGDQMVRRSPLKKGNKGATEDAQFMLDRAAAEGSLIDLSNLVLAETESGVLVAISDHEEIDKVTHELATIEQTYELARPAANGATHVKATADEESLGVQVVQKEGKKSSDGVNSPLGPGSLSLKDITNAQCRTARGSRYYNIMNWCYQKFFADDGNGRRPYGQSDDDGSSTRDYYSYKRWASVQPDKTPVRDYAVMEAHVFSWPTYNTKRYRGIRTLDWTPVNNRCTKDNTFSISSSVGIGWSTPTCISSTDISITEMDGRMKHYYKCTVCGGGTKNVGFHIGVKVWQNNIPYWHDDNYAAFRQAFTWKWDYIDD